MAIALGAVGTRVALSVAGTSYAVPYPAGIAAGDLLILHMSTNGSTVTTPAGWTEVYRETTLSNPKGGLWIKVATGSESGTLAVTTTSTTGNAVMLRYTGVDTTTPLDVAATNVRNTTTSATTILPSLTTVTNGAMLIYVNAMNSSSQTTTTVTPPGGTRRFDFNSPTTTGSKAGSFWEETWAVAGATSTRQINQSGSALANWGAMMALRPAATGQAFNASAALSGAGTLTGVNQTPNFIRTPDLSGSGTVKGVAVFGASETTFEDGTLQGWVSTVVGSGVVQVVAGAKHDGTLGVRVTTPADTVDTASIKKTITATPKARIAGWYRVTTEGLDTTNVSFARFMSGSTILAGMYRQNVTAGPNVWLRTAKADGTGYYFTSTGARMDLGDWAYIEFEWNQATGNAIVNVNGIPLINAVATDKLAATTIDSVIIGAPETGKSGVWEADTLRINSYQEAITPSGSGTLSPTVVPGFSVTVNLGGSGTLSGVGVVSRLASATLSGVGGLSATVTPGVAVTANLSGEGTLVGESGGSSQTIPVALSGSGTLTRSVVANFAKSMTQTGTGTLTSSVGGVSMSVAVAFGGVGTQVANQTTVTGSRTAPLSGSGTLGKSVTPAWSLTQGFLGSGTLSSTLSNTSTRNATLSGTGGLVGTVTGATRSASATLGGSGTLTAGLSTAKASSVALSGSGTLQPFVTSMGVDKAVALSGSGTLSATYFQTRQAFPAYSGVGGLVVTVKPAFTAQFNRVGEGSLEAEMAVAVSASASLSGGGQLSGVPDAQHNGTVIATLPPKRWNASLGTQRWKGYL